jgi:hypothetical protein
VEGHLVSIFPKSLAKWITFFFTKAHRDYWIERAGVHPSMG